MNDPRFEAFFTGPAREYLIRAIDLALEEDGPDLTSQAVFAPDDRLAARIVAKQDSLVAGLPILPLVLERMGDAARCEVAFPPRTATPWRIARSLPPSPVRP